MVRKIEPTFHRKIFTHILIIILALQLFCNSILFCNIDLFFSQCSLKLKKITINHYSHTPSISEPSSSLKLANDAIDHSPINNQSLFQSNSIPTLNIFIFITY